MINIREKMGKEILQYLKKQPSDWAKSSEIMSVFNIFEEDLNLIIEDLNRRKLLKAHQQSKSRSEPKYDVIKISDKGKEHIDG